MNIGGVGGAAGSRRETSCSSDRDLTIRNQTRRKQRGDCVREAWETAAMLDATAPDRADMAAPLWATMRQPSTFSS